MNEENITITFTVSAEDAKDLTLWRECRGVLSNLRQTLRERRKYSETDPKSWTEVEELFYQSIREEEYILRELF